MITRTAERFREGECPELCNREAGSVPTIGTASNGLVTACALTKLAHDKKAELEKVHAVAKKIKLENVETPDLIELHPGSQNALDELNK